MVTLRQAREDGKLDEFIAEREAENRDPGDEAAFNRAVEAMARTSRATPRASKKASRDG